MTRRRFAAGTFALAMIVGCGDDSPQIIATTTTAGVALEYGVTFSVTNAVGQIGALQFDADTDVGDWVGAGGGAACTWIVNAAIHACNDKRNGLMTCAVVDTGGFTGPLDLMRCAFTSNDVVTVDDFTVTVTDASTTYLTPIDVDVGVTSVIAR